MPAIKTGPLRDLPSLPIGDLEAASASEAAALSLIEGHRWPSGPRCPTCDSGEMSRVTGRKSAARKLFRCNSCGAQSSWRKGTAFSGSVNTPQQIVAAAHLLAGGSSELNVAEHLMDRFGFGPGRAASLVACLEAPSATDPAPPEEAQVETPAPAPAERPSDDRRSMGPAPSRPSTEPRDFPLSLDPADMDAVAADLKRHGQDRTRKGHPLLAGSIALLLIGGAVGALFPIGEVRAADPAVWTFAWKHGGDTMTWVSERLESESMMQWAQRYEAEVESLKSEFPPD